MCNLSERTQNKMFQRPELRVAMKKKKVSLSFRAGKRLLPKGFFLARRIKRDENRGRQDREILCGKDDRAVLNRKKKISATIFFERENQGLTP